MQYDENSEILTSIEHDLKRDINARILVCRLEAKVIHHVYKNRVGSQEQQGVEGKCPLKRD